MIESSLADRIGIDGGGTACRVALVWRGVRHDAAAGPANVTSDLAGAVAAINAGLAAVAGAAGVALEDLRPLPAYAGLAGVTGPSVAQVVAAALPLDAVRVEDDRHSAVVGALGDGDGAVTGVGTGSFVACRQGGAVRFGGGWGLVLGDEASGGWLGRGALARVLHVADGLAEETPLSAALLARFGGAEEIVRFAAGARAGAFAELAPEVLRAAAAGDAMACALMRDGADYLAAALAAAGWRAGMTLCLLGGVAAAYAPFLPEPMARCLQPAQGSALDGALRLAGDGA